MGIGIIIIISAGVYATYASIQSSKETVSYISTIKSIKDATNSWKLNKPQTGNKENYRTNYADISKSNLIQYGFLDKKIENLNKVSIQPGSETSSCKNNQCVTIFLSDISLNPCSLTEQLDQTNPVAMSPSKTECAKNSKTISNNFSITYR